MTLQHAQQNATPQRVIGMIGGMSWESTARYYRLANEEVRDRLGGLRSARVVLASVDFAEVGTLQVAGEWDRMRVGPSSDAVVVRRSSLRLRPTDNPRTTAGRPDASPERMRVDFHMFDRVTGGDPAVVILVSTARRLSPERRPSPGSSWSSARHPSARTSGRASSLFPSTALEAL